MDKDNYHKGGSAGSKGSQFQVHLLVVFLLNALRMKLTNWKLSTEDQRAGKFDDVVLEWSEGAVLLQAKHKENKKRITVDQLMSTTSRNDDFSIPKYFLSYQEIKAEFPSLKKAVICTNASVNEKALKFLNSHTDSSDSTLFCESEKLLFYTLGDDILPELQDIIKTYYSQNPRGIKVDESVITEENLKAFQKHFQIYFEYPSGSDLKEVAAKLLNRISWCAKASASEICSEVLDWFQQKDGKYFTALRARAMISEIRTEKYWKSLKQYDIRFPTTDVNLEDSNRRYHFIADGTCLLQEIRIWQGLRGKGKKALYIHTDDSLDDLKQLIKAFELENYTILIIIQPNDSVVMQWDQIEEILNKFAYKKVVLLMARVNSLVRRIQSGNNSFDVAKEPPTLEDLLEETRDRLLKAEKILFQGNVINLEELFAPRSIQDYRTSLGSEILERLVGGDQIRVGSKVSVLEEEVERSYIPRNFTRKNEKWHERNIFGANDRLILIADSAGMGKTTTLTKLAVLIKESRPHLWVAKIVLDHYSKFLKDSLRKHKRKIDITEFLNSQETTKLTNQLDKLVFSMDSKVVLMLDGVDEISPTYTELVDNLLANCLKAPNIIKIFATTRPHLYQKLEEKFQVKSFVLEPFSMENQIDFLNRLWIHNLGHIDRKKCEQYARALVQKMFSWTSSNFRREADFAAIPLHTKMLGEIFQMNGRSEGVLDWEGCQEFLNSERLEPKLPERIDLTRLYELFIEKKRNVFVDKLNPDGKAGAAQTLDDQFEGSLGFHRKLALEVIIDDKRILRLFSCYEKGGKNCTTNALRIGIVKEIDNKLHFTHRTFAEYFVAECLIIELKRQKPNVKFQKFLIDEIIRREEVICTFFDGFLQECGDIFPYDIFQNYLSRSVFGCLSCYIAPFDSRNFDLFYDLAKTGCVSTLKLLLKCINFTSIIGQEISLQDLDKNKIISRYFGNRLKTLQYLVQRGGVNIRGYADRTPLYVAAMNGHLKMVKFLVEQGANINSTNIVGCTPLHKAAAGGHLAVVEYLVAQGADLIPVTNVITGYEEYNTSELHGAILTDQVHIVDYLVDTILEVEGLERGLDAEYVMIPFAVAYLGRIDTLKFLIEKGMDVDRRIKNKQSLIFGAALGGQLEAVKYLVDQGADINCRDKFNNTLLHSISTNSSLISIGKFLVDLGIDVDAKNDGGQTALRLSVQVNAYDMAKLFIENGADVNNFCTYARWKEYILPLALNHVATLELLAEHGADVDCRDYNGSTLLHVASHKRNLHAVECLVKFGADVTAEEDTSGYTALRIAILKGNWNVTKFLMRWSDINSRDSDGNTDLHFTVSMYTDVSYLSRKYYFPDECSYSETFHRMASNRLHITKLLVARGANVNLTNNEGQTVLYLAILNVVLYCNFFSCDQCLLVVKFLIERGAVLDAEISNQDAKVVFAKRIQKYKRYRWKSLKDILLSPVFALLDPISPLNREGAGPSASV